MVSFIKWIKAIAIILISLTTLIFSFVVYKNIFYRPPNYKIAIDYQPNIDYEAIIIDRGNPDFQLLAEVSFFTDRHTFANVSDEINTFGRLYQDSNALNYFYILEAEASIEGKLFALCALYFLDYDYFRYRIEYYALSEDYVNIYYRNNPLFQLKDVIKSNAKDAVRLKNNEDTISDWLKRNFTRSFTVDFYGGSIPSTLIETISAKE